MVTSFFFLYLIGNVTFCRSAETHQECAEEMSVIRVIALLSHDVSPAHVQVLPSDLIHHVAPNDSPDHNVETPVDQDFVVFDLHLDHCSLFLSFL